MQRSCREKSERFVMRLRDGEQVALLESDFEFWPEDEAFRDAG